MISENNRRAKYYGLTADRLYVLFQTSGRAGRTRVTPLDFSDLQACWPR